jgi:uncharacterized protein (DUF362 family)
MVTRRRFLIGAPTTAVVAAGPACVRSPRWEATAYRKKPQSRVVVLRAQDYAQDLTEIVLRGVQSFGLSLHGKRVVLKPNLVEFDPAGVINTHPAVIAAAIDAFRRLGARSVVVAEGPGHRRDTEHLVVASGLQAVLQEHQVAYVDLNWDEVRPIAVRSRFTALDQFYFPQTVLSADLLVSMPKLKTHHWAGVTLSLKNLFGIIPGALYGWPKNVLHWAGINESILDINSTLPVPTFAIVDGIVGMEGNGPIQGAPKRAGVLVFGDDPVAVDASAARLMGLAPEKVPYLKTAGMFLGNLAPNDIAQAGERLDSVRQEFTILGSFQHLQASA